MSCLFNSLSEYLHKENKPISSDKLRHQICDYLSTNPIMLDDNRTKFKDLLKNKSLVSYISNMRNPSTWGSAFEINAFCNLYHTQVIVRVISSSRDIKFFPLSCCTTKIVRLLWNGSHYSFYSSS